MNKDSVENNPEEQKELVNLLESSGINSGDLWSEVLENSTEQEMLELLEKLSASTWF
jgi:hypothetical protein